MFRSTLSAALIGSGVAQYGYNYGYGYYGYGYEYYVGVAYEYGYDYYDGDQPPMPPYCDDSCQLDLAPIEKFTADYEIVNVTRPDPYGNPGEYVTGALPADIPSDHGTLAIRIRDLQLKLDNHFVIPDDMEIPAGPDGPDPFMEALLGQDIHEQLYINGRDSRASYSLASPILNMCIQVDVPGWVPIDDDAMEENLQQAQDAASTMVQQTGLQVTVDGQEDIAVPGLEGEVWVVSAGKSYPDMVVTQVDLQTGEVGRTGSLIGMKFSNYVRSVGNQFDVRACEITDQSATQTTLAGNAQAREFIASRIATHQRRLQALLEPKGMNTRFNFIPLHFLSLMVPAVPKVCTNDVLAETAPMGASILQTGLLGVGSCAMGFAASFGALRKKGLPSTDGYLLSA